MIRKVNYLLDEKLIIFWMKTDKGFFGTPGIFQIDGDTNSLKVKKICQSLDKTFISFITST